MSEIAYVDSSYLVAIVFDEPNVLELKARLDEFEEIFSSPLLEAEVRSTFHRKSILQDVGTSAFLGITWLIPQRPLSEEITKALKIGYLRGADLWHVASALFLSPRPGEISFLSLDEDQKNVAHHLGFKTN